MVRIEQPVLVAGAFDAHVQLCAELPAAAEAQALRVLAGPVEAEVPGADAEPLEGADAAAEFGGQPAGRGELFAGCAAISRVALDAGNSGALLLSPWLLSLLSLLSSFAAARVIVTA